MSDPGRRRRLLINTALVAAVGLGFVAVEKLSNRDQAPGNAADTPAAPDFRLPLISGGGGLSEVTLASFHGRPVVVNFWASWCTACREERPMLSALRDGADGAMLGIATMDKDGAVRLSEAENPHGYVVALDADGTVAHRYGIEGLPQTLVLDANGRILRRIVGSLKETDVDAIKRMVATSGSTTHAAE